MRIGGVPPTHGGGQGFGDVPQAAKDAANAIVDEMNEIDELNKQMRALPADQRGPLFAKIADIMKDVYDKMQILDGMKNQLPEQAKTLLANVEQNWYSLEAVIAMGSLSEDLTPGIDRLQASADNLAALLNKS